MLLNKCLGTALRVRAVRSALCGECTAAGDGLLKELEFIGYDSWAEFTQSCCCMARPRTNISDTPWVELWACDGSGVAGNASQALFKERQRKQDVDERVHFVRPFCGRQFLDQFGQPLPNQEPRWSETHERFGIDYPVYDDLGNFQKREFIEKNW